MRNGLFRFDPRPARAKLAETALRPGQRTLQRRQMRSAGALLGRHHLRAARCGKATLHCFAGGKLLQRAGGDRGNGLAWSPNGRTMYWTDTKAHTIYAFDFEPATGADRRPARLRALPAQTGRPAARALRRPARRRGGRCRRLLLVAMFEGQRLLRLSPAGEVLREVKAAGALCHHALLRRGRPEDDLPHHSAREAAGGRTRGAANGAGCVLAFEVDVPGLPVNFAS